MTRIQCPFCHADLRLRKTQPGTYRPTCKQCQKPFVITIETTVDVAQEQTQSGSSDESENPFKASSRQASIRQTPTALALSDASSRHARKEETTTLTRLAGYQILTLLGQGAMGAVYQARQISLDRLVAIKTIRDRWTTNPTVVARFAREAYAAAQVVHHNVVQIYDFGEEAGQHFFSMEWVRGGSLQALVKDKGPLDSRVAAGYILQAARGLLIVHERGMVHQDIKPANLLLDEHGVVKIADLGLVKLPGDSPQRSNTVGTPAYMAPEQAVGDGDIDHRADIYSLGCTLFYLLTGQPPAPRPSAMEALPDCDSDSFPDVTALNRHVNPGLQIILRRATQSDPADRYPSMGALIGDLRDLLGVREQEVFSPTQKQADQMESLAQQYHRALPKGWLWNWKLTLLASSGSLLTLLSLVVNWHWCLLGAFVVMSCLTTAITLAGKHSELHLLVRRWFASLRPASRREWASLFSGLFGWVLLTCVILLTGLWPGAFLGSLIGIIVAWGYHVLAALPTRLQTEPIRQEAQQLIRELRMQGTDENSIRLFVARYAGSSWQAFFESLFGNAARRAMTLQRESETTESDAPDSASTLDGLFYDRVCEWLRRRCQSNTQLRDQSHLASIEQRSLISEGVASRKARRQAWDMAAAVMEAARLSVSTQPNVDHRAAAKLKRERMKMMLAEARSGKYAARRKQFSLSEFLVSEQMRMLLGCLLLVVFAISGRSVGWFDSISAVDTLTEIGAGNVDFDAVRQAAITAGQEDSDDSIIALGVNLWSIAITGVMMIVSGLVSNWRMTPIAVVASIVILFGPSLGVPAVGSLLAAWVVAAVAGLAIYVPRIRNWRFLIGKTLGKLFRVVKDVFC